MTFAGRKENDVGERFDLNIELNYRLRTGYNRLLKAREWVRGLPVEIRINVTNMSAKAFPGTEVKATIMEHGQSVGLQSLSWSTVGKMEIPPLQPGNSATLEPAIGFIPILEGLCEVRLDLGEPAESEVWIKGWRQSEPQRKGIRGLFSVVRWQDMEIISLLRKLEKGG